MWLVDTLIDAQVQLPAGLVTELRKFRVERNITDWDSDPRPYVKVAAAIFRRIENGNLRPGSYVPSHRAIASRYEVSVPTAGKAVQLLTAAGLAERVGNAYRVRDDVSKTDGRQERSGSPDSNNRDSTE